MDDAVARPPADVSSCCPKSSSTERTSIWYCCCRTASVQMLGFPRTFSSGMGFQKKLRTLRFFLALVVEEVAGGGGGGGAPGGGGGRGGGGGAALWQWPAASVMARVCPDMEDGPEAEVVEEEAVQPLPSLLQLSASSVVDGRLITSIPRRSSQRRCKAGVRKTINRGLLRLKNASRSTGSSSPRLHQDSVSSYCYNRERVPSSVGAAARLHLHRSAARPSWRAGPVEGTSRGQRVAGGEGHGSAGGEKRG